MTDKILLIHVNKETQEYSSYETYSLSQILKEGLLQKVEEYNSNPEKTTIVKVYEDELLVQFVADVRASVSRKRLFSELKDIMHELDSDICSLQNAYDDIETLIGETDNIEEVDNYRNALYKIKEIVSSTLDCGEWIGQGDNKMEQILQKIDEVLYVENN